MSREDQLIDWLRRRLDRQGADRLGDDAALLSDRTAWAISVDQQIEGVHYPRGLDARTVGRRLVAVCLSDLAACGARPAYCTLAVALPPAYPARRLLTGVLESCKRYGLELVGGDTASTPETAVCSLTVFGRRPSGGRWLRRSSARPGDGLWIGGSLGESALGRRLLEAGARIVGRRVELPPGLGAATRLEDCARRAVRRHLAPTPQLELGTTLGRRARVAALDVSDGLALDLHRLCWESGVGAEIALGDLPRPRGLDRLAALLGLETDDLLLAGGEDYVLLFTLPPSAIEPPVDGCRRIGRITTGPGVRRVTARGTVPLKPAGWDHLAET